MWLSRLSGRQIAFTGMLFAVAVLTSFQSSSYLVSATELDLFTDKDHNHHRIWQDLPDGDTGGHGAQPISAGYQAEFPGISRSIIGRADQVPSLLNNVPISAAVSSGQTTNFVFQVPNEDIGADLNLPSQPPNSGLMKRGFEVEDYANESVDGEILHASLKKRQDSPTVYISVTMCNLPSTGQQLTLYFSQTNQNPGASSTDSTTSVPLVDGNAMATLPGTGNVFIGVSAPPSDTSVEWDFVVGASIDNYVQDFESQTPFAFTVDTDSNSALLSTLNLTDSSTLNNDLRQKWLDLNTNAPFSMFIFNGSTALDGLQNSYCGLVRLQSQGLTMSTGISTRNIGQNPKQDFYIQNLQPGTTYQAALAYNGTAKSSAPGANTLGGGMVWKVFTFTTKSDGNCQIIYNLPFCSDVAYAVPSNATANMSQLVDFYDNSAMQYWQNFTNSLQQVACNTTDSAQYSLVKTCDDCKNDYKTWLCSALIPRCQDLSSVTFPAAYTIARNVAADFTNGSTPDLTDYNLPSNASEITWYNSSRNAQIDSDIKPGPYKELLPCQDLCYEIVRSCPAVMGFSCPRLAQGGLFNRSYGVFDVPTVKNTEIWTCNYLGIDPPQQDNGAMRIAGWGAGMGVLMMLHLIVYGL